MNRPLLNSLCGLLAVVMLVACSRESTAPPPTADTMNPPASLTSTVDTAVVHIDPHSYADPQAFVTRHLALDLQVDFDARVLRGTAQLDLQRNPAAATDLVLDTRDLRIEHVETASADGVWQPTTFTLAPADAVLGSALHIAMPANATRVKLSYSTQPQASGLQWLTPAQTAGGTQPFLYSQSQAIHARSWIPLQDTPAVRATYEARIRTPQNLRAVMSADNDGDTTVDGDYRFSMPQPIPSYLIALAVGDLRFAAIGAQTGVYAEPSMLAASAAEFADTQAMLERCAAIFGPYRWGRYDLLILPPSFPYGGMENPRLTFVTPTVITGDKALVSLIAHELAHSWSGNLVTNASWNDFWLNEGFTNHLTYRIMEELYGAQRAAQERALGANDLKDTLARLDVARDKTLIPDLAGRDPDDGVTDVPYERGALFLAFLEARYGRPAFDAFLREWFDAHAFTSVTTADFLAFLDARLRKTAPDAVSDADLNAWLREPDMPASTPWPQSDAFARVDAARQAWLDGAPAATLDTAAWSTRQWQYFLDAMPATLSAGQLAALDAAFAFSAGSNRVIASRWFRLVAANEYRPAFPAMEKHLLAVGRMALLTPIYRELARSEPSLAWAKAVYAKASAGYHPIAQDAVEKILRGS